MTEMPVYHTRAMQSEFIQSFGHVTGVKSAIIREAYKQITWDKQVREVLDMEDPDLI